MAGQRAEVLTGAAVILAAIGFVVYAGEITGRGTGNVGSYDLKASFRSVEGITAGSDVRLAGVKVGTITSLTLNPTTFFADATILVDQAVQLAQAAAPSACGAANVDNRRDGNSFIGTHSQILSMKNGTFPSARGIVAA